MCPPKAWRLVRNHPQALLRAPDVEDEPTTTPDEPVVANGGVIFGDEEDDDEEENLEDMQEELDNMMDEEGMSIDIRGMLDAMQMPGILMDDHDEDEHHEMWTMKVN